MSRPIVSSSPIATCLFTLHHFLRLLSSLLHKSPFHLLITTNESFDDQLPQATDCVLTASNATVVMKNLGLWRPEEEEGHGGRRVEYEEVVKELLEEKEASVGELREAFCIFDRDDDGHITPTEVRGVMKRLGLREGLGLEECERMVEAFDEDGDGTICFSEFRKMLENAR